MLLNQIIQVRNTEFSIFALYLLNATIYLIFDTSNWSYHLVEQLDNNFLIYFLISHVKFETIKIVNLRFSY